MSDDKYPVNRGKNGKLEVKDNIQDKLTKLLEEATATHNKIIVIRDDIRYPEGYKASGDNSDFMKMNQKQIQKYKRKGYDPRYMFVREQSGSDNPHYHRVIMLNANKTRYGYQVKEDAEKLWGSTLDADVEGCIHYCDKAKDGSKQPNGVILNRSNKDFKSKFNEVHHQISYLAKARDKGKVKDGVRDFGMSRLKKKKD